MTTPIWSARCPAKVNLALRVLGRRPDGYHELHTVFQAIALEDVVTAAPDDEIRVECSDPAIPTDASNLVVRAAREVADRLGVRAGARFRIGKTIPAGAGLGGGSTDAAAAIVLVERLWGVDLGPEERTRVAASIGADVPFFLFGGTAVGTGRGDRIRPLPYVGDLRLLLGVPDFSASTAEVFEALSDRLTLPRKGVSVPRLSGSESPRIVDVCAYGNDLETVVFDRWPALRRFRDRLREHGAGAALLSGSGSTVYGVFDTDERRERAAGFLRRDFPGWRLVRSGSVAHGIRIERLDPGR